MHIPDGFLSPPVWLSFDAISVPAIGWIVHRAKKAAPLTPDAAHIPLLGVMGAFVFAAQMINFPVGLGASGHLLGGSLLAIILGPAAAMLVMTAVIVLQALLFQDGGVLVVGVNIFNMAIAGVAAGYLPVRLMGRSAFPVFLGGAFSVLVSAALVLWQLSLSGVAITGRPLWTASVLFAITAVLEGLITVAAIRAIGRLSPHSLPDQPQVSFPARAAFATLALLLATGGTWIASAAPDGLQHLAANIGLEANPVWTSALLDGWPAPAAGITGLACVYALCTLGGKRR
ncbi:MAG: energy-coupling factor ABC transporter permease [Bryobacteraceae bacterium]